MVSDPKLDIHVYISLATSNTVYQVDLLRLINNKFQSTLTDHSTDYSELNLKM